MEGKIEAFKNFSKLDFEGRLKRLQDLGFLDEERISYLRASSKNIPFAETLIENPIGWLNLPLGVAVNFVINDRLYALPLAVEETSIIAAASKAAKWVARDGELRTKTLGFLSTGQIQFPVIKDRKRFEDKIRKNFPKWQSLVHDEVLKSMWNRGGGLKDFEVRFLTRPDQKTMACLHLYIDTKEAMGANTINQVAEYLKPFVERETGEKALLCILSNLSDKKMSEARVILKNQDLDLIKKIEEASLFAEMDPYRAATSNKGVLNGIDGLMIATGNDWRSVEAGLHAFASTGGHYKSLTKWRVVGDELHGSLKAPFLLGVVGGVTDLHPQARLCLDLLGRPSSRELSELACALGLIQNLAALRALVTEGVIEGHMKLHIKNLTQKAGAKNEELLVVEKEALRLFKMKKRISLSDVKQVLKDHQNLKR